MLKKVLAATAVLAIAGSSIVYAQRAGGPGRPDDRDGPRRPEMQRFTQDDMSAFADARVAALRAGLKLTPDQEKNWPAFESAYRNIAKLRADRRTERMDAWRKRREAREQDRGQGRDQGRDQNRDQNANADRGADLIVRLQRRADAMTKGAAAFKQLTDAAAPLYQSLDEAQKRRFTFLTRFMNGRSRFAAMEERGGFEHRGPRGFGRGGHPRFGAADGIEQNEFAVNPPEQPDLAGLASEDRSN